MSRVLVVEDEQHLADGLRFNLEAEGYQVQVAETGSAGQFVPTLMLTARGHPEDVLNGFAAGADDYLTKPFELSILIARIRGLLRRREWLRSSVNPVIVPPPEPVRKDRFVFGDKSVEFD